MHDKRNQAVYTGRTESGRSCSEEYCVFISDRRGRDSIFTGERNTCGNRYASRAETLIPGGFAGVLARNGVVFLRMVRWISFLESGDGDNAG